MLIWAGWAVLVYWWLFLPVLVVIFVLKRFLSAAVLAVVAYFILVVAIASIPGVVCPGRGQCGEAWVFGAGLFASVFATIAIAGARELIFYVISLFRRPKQ
jgi:hypothetical protein